MQVAGDGLQADLDHRNRASESVTAVLGDALEQADIALDEAKRALQQGPTSAPNQACISTLLKAFDLPGHIGYVSSPDNALTDAQMYKKHNARGSAIPEHRQEHLNLGFVKATSTVCS